MLSTGRAEEPDHLVEEATVLVGEDDHIQGARGDHGRSAIASVAWMEVDSNLALRLFWIVGMEVAESQSIYYW